MFTSIVLILAGIFAVWVAVADPDWYFDRSYRVKMWVKMFGRDVVRLMSGFFGAIALFAGLVMLV